MLTCWEHLSSEQENGENWHEDTVPIYVVARETDVLKGTSRIGFAGSGSYNIGLFNTTREYLF